MLRILSMSHNELRIGKKISGMRLKPIHIQSGFLHQRTSLLYFNQFFLWVANRWCHVAVEGRLRKKKMIFLLGNERVKLLAYPFSHSFSFCMWQIDNVSLEGSEERNLCLYDECYDCDVVYKQPIYIILFSLTWLWGTTRRKINRIF